MRVAVRALLATMLAGAVLTLGAPPSTAEVQLTLVSPRPGEVLSGPFDIVVETQVSDGDLVDGVDARISGASNRVYTLQAEGPPDIDGRQRWVLSVDPLAGDPFANGAHRIAVRPASTTSPDQAWTGHEVRLVVPYRGQLVAAPTGEDPTVVTLTWDPVDLPDFLRYRIERRPDAQDGLWRTVAEFTDPATRDASDAVPAPGAYRYRLVVVRSDGADAEVHGYSPARGVRADPADPGTFDPPPEPDPNPTPTPRPTPTDDDVAQGGGGGAGDPGPPETQTAGTPAQPRPPQVTVNPPPAPPGPRPPRVVPLDDQVFEEQLPLPDDDSEVTVGETETAFVDGSVRAGDTLAVLTEEPIDRSVVAAGAMGLLLVVVAGHVRRFLGDGRHHT